MSSRAASTGLRHINGLLNEIEIIQVECGGKGAKNVDTKLDHFQRTKLELNDLLKVLKSDITTQKGIEKRLGTNSESIKLKHAINKNLIEAKRLHTELEMAFEQDEKDYDNGLSDVNNIKERKELVELMKQDLEYHESIFDPNKDKNTNIDTGGSGFRLAAQVRANRKKKRAKGVMSSEPQPLTALQQTFIQQSIKRDKILDDKLDIIKKNVIQLNAIGTDINEEFDRQAVMLEEVEQKMIAVTDKLESRNAQMKQLLERQGGGTKWTCILILFIIFLACCGYIYNAFIA